MEPVEVVSGKALWGVICGTYVLPSDEVVGAELQLAAPHLRVGLAAYKKPTDNHYKTWADTAEATQAEKDFVKKLSQLLDLAAVHSWEVFQLFLLHEYRGAEASLVEVLASQRDEETFLAQLWSFYLSDRLHLLRCLRHIVANTANRQHPYQSLFGDFMQDVLDKDGTLGESLVQQVLLCTRMVSPTPQTHGPHLPSHGPHTWLAHHLAELREVLATLLVYYGSTTRSPTPDTFKKLVQLAQGGGLAGRSEIQEGLRDSHGPLVEALDATHMLLLILAINADSPTSGHNLCDSGWVSKLDPIMAGLGARTPHLAPLLAWAVLQLRTSGGTSSGHPKIYHKLAQRALHGNVFGYLQTALNNTAIKGDELLLRLGSSVVYSLVCAAAGSLDLDRVDYLPVLNSLAKNCLAHDPPAHLFWSEEGGGAGLLLPQALQVFPHDVEPLLSLTTALALANPESCHKVVELLSELPSITWVVPEAESQNIQIRLSDCYTTGPLHLMPTVTVATHTRGMLISTEPLVVMWQMETNAWQGLLAIMKLLDNEVGGGASLLDPRLITAVSATMRLLSSVLTTVPTQLPALIHFVHQTVGLLHK
ncbi:nucleoporin NUP188-like [Homarus americanus]|nr:nucleoporin NUP188-like [Homarus americanus]